MPKRKREPTEEEREATRLKRSEAQKKRWQDPEYRKKQLAILAAAREQRYAPRRAIKADQKAKQIDFRHELRALFVQSGYSKKEAQELISHIRQDLFKRKKQTKTYRRLSKGGTQLPPLYNPLPKFIGENFGKIANFFKRRTQQHIEGLFTYFRPFAEATGIIPPGTPIFDIVIQALK